MQGKSWLSRVLFLNLSTVNDDVAQYVLKSALWLGTPQALITASRPGTNYLQRCLYRFQFPAGNFQAGSIVSTCPAANSPLNVAPL